MASPTTQYLGLTGDQLIDATTSGYSWRLTSDRTVDFSVSNGFYGETWNDIVSVNNYMGSALNLFSYYSNIKFNFAGYFLTPSSAASGGSEINLSVDGYDIFFGSYSTWAIGLFPNSSYDIVYPGAPGDIYLNLNSLANYLPSYEPGSQGWFLLIHELGHALGLKHPHDDGGTGRPTFSSLGLDILDIDLATIMSYNDDGQWNMFSWDPAEPMILDVYALQYLYGKNLTTNSGNDTYRVANDGYYRTVWDASGVDTIDASLNNAGWKIFLPQQSLSSLVDTKAGYALQLSESNSLVPTTLYWLAGDFENAIGSEYGDMIFGNLFNNILNGGAGVDTMIGGAGNDTYYVDSASDFVTESVGEGADLVYASTTFTLGNNVESLTLTGTASINGTGNGLNNTITGNSGNNTLNGGTGNDTLIGGAGNDTYVVDSLTDTINEDPGAGTDLVQSNISFSLAALTNLENLTLTGNGAIDGTGNGLNNTITGNGGNNTLNGGAGIDTLIGGLGNDTYVVDSATDTITELSGGGTDTVRSSVTFTLATTPLANIENLTLTGTAAINGTGNGLNNTLTGNSAANVLNGGVGNDTMAGGLGNDTYVVNSALDVVTEASAAGTDTIRTTLTTYSLAALTNLENLTLIGTGNATLTGNASNNVITGNAGNDTINGGAGNDTLIGGAGDDWLEHTDDMGTPAGNDTLIGGLGNDTYVADILGATLVEAANEGTDLVYTFLDNFTLAENIENLSHDYGNDPGDTSFKNFIGTGNSLDNIITSNGGNDILYGLAGNDTLNGGLGNDELYGGAGNDSVYGGGGDDLLIAYLEYEDSSLSDTGFMDALDIERLNSLDTLYGGAGNDLYVIDRFANTPTITENINEGSDTILADLQNYTIVSNVENYINDLSISIVGVSQAITINGNELDNIIKTSAESWDTTSAMLNTVSSTFNAREVFNGNAGNDTLISGLGNDTLNGDAGNDTLIGGAGNDTLTGGLGNDYFVFNSTPNATSNRDTITDFNVVADTIQLENSIFTSLVTTGTLDATMFRKGAGVNIARDANDYIIYNTRSGALYYDADGVGGSAAVQIALIGTSTHANLTVADLVVI